MQNLHLLKRSETPRGGVASEKPLTSELPRRVEMPKECAASEKTPAFELPRWREMPKECAASEKTQTFELPRWSEMPKACAASEKTSTCELLKRSGTLRGGGRQERERSSKFLKIRSLLLFLRSRPLHVSESTCTLVRGCSGFVSAMTFHFLWSIIRWARGRHMFESCPLPKWYSE